MLAGPPQEVPHLLEVGQGILAILKPVGWEVLTEESAGTRNTLTQFLREEALLGNLYLPLLQAGLQDYTFCTILDAPCSGIVLAATSMHGFWASRSQIQVYEIDREYIVAFMCAG